MNKVREFMLLWFDLRSLDLSTAVTEEFQI